MTFENIEVPLKSVRCSQLTCKLWKTLVRQSHFQACSSVLAITYLEEFQFLQEEEWLTVDMSNPWP